jgi:hypothetical protein
MQPEESEVVYGDYVGVHGAIDLLTSKAPIQFEELNKSIDFLERLVGGRW